MKRWFIGLSIGFASYIMLWLILYRFAGYKFEDHLCAYKGAIGKVNIYRSYFYKNRHEKTDDICSYIFGWWNDWVSLHSFEILPSYDFERYAHHYEIDEEDICLLDSSDLLQAPGPIQLGSQNTSISFLGATGFSEFDQRNAIVITGEVLSVTRDKASSMQVILRVSVERGYWINSITELIVYRGSQYVCKCYVDTGGDKVLECEIDPKSWNKRGLEVKVGDKFTNRLFY